MTIPDIDETTINCLTPIAEGIHEFYQPTGGICPLERCYSHASDILLALAEAGFCLQYVGRDAMTDFIRRHHEIIKEGDEILAERGFNE